MDVGGKQQVGRCEVPTNTVPSDGVPRYGYLGLMDLYSVLSSVALSFSNVAEPILTSPHSFFAQLAF